jgi:hypothetical protein
MDRLLYRQLTSKYMLDIDQNSYDVRADMRVALTCVIIVCMVCLAASWPYPFIVSDNGDNKYVFFGRNSNHVTLASERDSAWVGARSADGIYGWAIISGSDGRARLQVRDEDGKAISIDLLKAVRILQSLGN